MGDSRSQRPGAPGTPAVEHGGDDAAWAPPGASASPQERWRQMSDERANIAGDLKRRSTVQRKASAPGAPSGGAASRAASAPTSGGAPVDAGVRSRVEKSTGASLGDVRVHTGAESARAADSIQAHAYTVGRDVHFAAGQYRPGSSDGERLIAHELVHTIQQGASAGAPQAKARISQSGDAAEREADSVADAALRGGRTAPVERTGDISRFPNDLTVPGLTAPGDLHAPHTGGGPRLFPGAGASAAGHGATAAPRGGSRPAAPRSGQLAPIQTRIRRRAGAHAHGATSGGAAHAAPTGRAAHAAPTGGAAHAAPTGAAPAPTTGGAAHAAPTGAAPAPTTGGAAPAPTTGGAAPAPTTGAAHAAPTGGAGHRRTPAAPSSGEREGSEARTPHLETGAEVAAGVEATTPLGAPDGGDPADHAAHATYQVSLYAEWTDASIYDGGRVRLGSNPHLSLSVNGTPGEAPELELGLSMELFTLEIARGVELQLEAAASGSRRDDGGVSAGGEVGAGVDIATGEHGTLNVSGSFGLTFPDHGPPEASVALQLAFALHS